MEEYARELFEWIDELDEQEPDRKELEMGEKQGRITVTFKHAPGDVVVTSLGDKGVIKSCTHERGGSHYTVNLAGDDRAYLHEDDVFTETRE